MEDFVLEEVEEVSPKHPGIVFCFLISGDI
jgi:hypothetical protein